MFSSKKIKEPGGIDLWRKKTDDKLIKLIMVTTKGFFGKLEMFLIAVKKEEEKTTFIILTIQWVLKHPKQMTNLKKDRFTSFANLTKLILLKPWFAF
jgi:hypothetical protein